MPGMKRSAITGRYVTQNNGKFAEKVPGGTPLYDELVKSLPFETKFRLEFRYRSMPTNKIVGVIND